MPKYVSTLLVSILALVAVQFGVLSPASAAADTDLTLSGARGMGNQGIQFQVCNNGPTSIKEIEFGISMTNATISEISVSIFGNGASDLGSFDLNTLTWTGEVAASECIPLLVKLSETGNLGDVVTTSISITSATQVDDTVNTDTNPGDETLALAPYTIGELADIDVDARLATTGTITPSSTVEYELTLQNIGAGQYNDSGFFILAFVLPPDAAFDSFEDGDVGDSLDVDSCASPGTVGDLGFPGLSAYNSRVIVVCDLTADGGVLPADDTVYPFTVSIVAGPSMAGGTADVIGIVEGNDLDTLELFRVLIQGGDPLTMSNNGIFHLSYDPSALSTTVARCAGQGETTNDGTGCFTLTFNKLIYAPSFGEDDIDIDGNGSIDSLTQLDEYTWQVNISGIALNSTVTLLLNLNQIQDYSAQQNSTQVLGINTIRYELTNNSSGSGSGNTQGGTSGTVSGSLPTTGSTSGYEIFVALVLIGSGLGALGLSRVKTKHLLR